MPELLHHCDTLAIKASSVNAIARKTFFICLAAGGVGAVVSVLTRMGSGEKFRLDYEIGRTRAVNGLLMSKIFQLAPPEGTQASPRHSAPSTRRSRTRTPPRRSKGARAPRAAPHSPRTGKGRP